MTQAALTPSGPSRHHDGPRRLDRRRGAHVCLQNGRSGVRFSVAAPHATHVAVVGDFNAWNGASSRMRQTADGLWECFVPEVGPGALYKYRIRERGGAIVERSDPFARACEVPPGTASRGWDLSRYAWNDHRWMSDRARCQRLGAPLSIYEVHVGSWRRQGHGAPLSYRELAPRLRALIAEGPRGPDEAERARIQGAYDAGVGAAALDEVVAFSFRSPAS